MGCLQREACVVEAHKPASIDYLTLHVWPNNWGWIEFKNQPGHLCRRRGQVPRLDVTSHIAIARTMGKPLVIEEFGLIREDRAFTPGGPTTHRDWFYRMMFGLVEADMMAWRPLAGTNFWAWNGEGRAQHPDAWFKMGATGRMSVILRRRSRACSEVFDADALNVGRGARSLPARWRPWPGDRPYPRLKRPV